MSRGAYLLGVGMALIALGFAFTEWALSPAPGVTVENFRRLRKGMTPGQVAALLGGPPHRTLTAEPMQISHWDFGHGTRLIFVLFRRGEGLHESYVYDREDHGGFELVMDMESPETKSSPLARLRAWLGW